MIDYIPLKTTLNSLTLLIALALITGLVLAQILFYFLKRKALYLALQIQALCFVVQPLLLVNVISLIYSNEISQILGLSICIATELLSSLLSNWLLFESYRVYSLKCQGSYITSEMMVYQLLLIALSFVESYTIEVVLGVIILMVSVGVYARHFV